MGAWTLEPRDTLVLRDGRPVQEGSPWMGTLDFPWPSSVAGLVRTRLGRGPDGRFALTPAEARAIPVAGPWLVELDDSGMAVDWFAPSPLDCVWGEAPSGSGRACRFRVGPLPLSGGCRTDREDLAPVGLRDGLRPQGRITPPAFWSSREILAWLLAPRETEEVDVAAFGLPAMEREDRVHVSIDPETGTARDGALFGTEGLRFVRPRPDSLRSPRRFALGLLQDDPRLTPGVVTLGGERRPSFLAKAVGAAAPAFPGDGPWTGPLLRVLLLTPGLFHEGHRPASIRGAEVVAAAVGRPRVISGWDFEAGGPKPTRRAAPPGSVYWVRLPSGADPKAWAQEAWMNTVSDEEQDRRDGFGLCLVGAA